MVLYKWFYERLFYIATSVQPTVVYYGLKPTSLKRYIMKNLVVLIRRAVYNAGKRLYQTSSTVQPSKASTMHRTTIDVRSDTVTQPSAEMRKAMANAIVGDDVYKEDPTVNELEKKVADLLGKEAALFVPSGTMSNLIAMMAHCDSRGQEILLGDRSHIFFSEQGGMAQIAGIQPNTLHTNPNGTFEFEELVQKVRDERINNPRTGLICIENTHNRCGGTALPLEYLDRLGAIKRQLGIPIHLDGSRLFNAAIYHKVSVSRLARHCDSVNVCLSKGLGAPVGSMVSGNKAFIAKAIRIRKVLGGGMRQSGALAAAGIYALDNMVVRLEDDHRRTLSIAKAIEDASCPEITVNMALVHTNILMIYLKPGFLSSKRFCERMEMITSEEATALKSSVIIKMSPFGPYVVRLVVHADVSEDDVNLINRKLQYVIKEFSSSNNKSS